MNAVARPLYLHAGGHAVLGLFHAPEATPTGIGVLICPPWGWEDVSSYRSRRDWADALARGGHAALRIDLPGTGDSGGDQRDPGISAAWTEAVAAAVQWLRDEAGATRVAVIGLGLGGLVACRAVAAGAPIDDLVLWAVPARGRALLRQQRAFAALEAAEETGRGEGGPEPAEGELHASGFVMSAETVADIDALDLTRLGGPAPSRVLLLERDGLAPDDRLRAHLEAAGSEVTTAVGDGYGAMTGHPEQARPPLEVFDRVAGWLAVAPAHPPAPPVAPASDPSAGPVEGVRETPLSFEAAGVRVFGILAEPADGPPAAICAVLLNAGALRRIGPNRMWTQAARRWAAAGIPVLRLDVEAIGDADGDASRFGEVAELYVPGYVDQVRAALDELERRGAPGRFVLVGLCSGAFWAFHAAQRDDRVPAVVMVNPRLFFWDEWVDAARDWRKLSGALRPRGLAALLRASNPLRRLIAVLLWIVRLPAHMAVRRRARREAMRAGGDDLDRALDRLRDTGTRVTMIFSGEEPLFDELRREGRLERMDRWPNVEIVGAPGRSHTLKPEWVQAAVGALLDRAIERERAAPDPERAYS